MAVGLASIPSQIFLPRPCLLKFKRPLELHPGGVFRSSLEPAPGLLRTGLPFQAAWVDSAVQSRREGVGGQDSRVSPRPRSSRTMPPPARRRGLSLAWMCLGRPINSPAASSLLLSSFHLAGPWVGCPNGDGFLAKQTAESILSSTGERWRVFLDGRSGLCFRC